MSTTPDLTFYRLVHRSMRTSSRQLHAALSELGEADTDRIRALSRWFDGFAGELLTHHRVEDQIFFPALASRVPTYIDDSAGEVAVEHHDLDVLIERITVSLRELAAGRGWPCALAETIADAAALRDLLEHHLDFEDADILPLFESRFTAEEYQALEDRAVADTAKKQMLFTVPWFVSHLDDDERAYIFGTVPAALRIVWRVTRRGYARRAAVAFGSPVEATLV
jgi:hemerythrin-like domain-containing protein